MALTQPIYCLTHKRKATATTDHLGRLTCSECGDTVKPVVIRKKTTA